MEGFGRVGPFQSPYFGRVQNYQAQFLTSFQSLGNNIPQNVSNFGGPSHAFQVPEQPITSHQEPPRVDRRNEEISCGSNSKETQNSAPVQDDGPASLNPGEFTCEHCNRKFSFKNALCEHLRAYHNVKKAFRCQEPGCSGSFMKQKSLDCHLKNVHHENINVEKRKYKLVNGKWICDICNKPFNSQPAVCNHRLFHFEPRFSCIYCIKKFHLNGGLQRHLKRHRGEIPSQAEKTFPCVECKRRFRKEATLANHECEKKPPKIKTKLPKAQYKSEKVKNHLCENCGKGYCSNESLIQHVLKAHGDNNCKLCSSTFDNPRDLLYHLTETHNAEPPEELIERISKIKDQRLGEFLCEFCSKVFTRTSVFNKHLLIHYEKELQYQCPVCRTQLTSIEEVKNHLEETHRDLDLTKIVPLTLPKCHLCNKKFRNDEALAVHNNRLHAPKEKICPYCNKIFSGKNKKAYYIHIRVHNGFKPYQCNHCPKKFAQKGNLNLHVQNHLKENKNYCRLCKILFVTKEKHQQHLNEKHLGKTKYICQTCYWGSDDKKKFKYHLFRSHRKEVKDDKKPHKCQFCPNRYTEWHSLRKHYTKCKNNADKIVPPPPSLRKKKQFPKNVEEIVVSEVFLCKFCFFIYATPIECYYHFALVHSNLSDDNFFSTNMMVGINRADENTKFNELSVFMSKESNTAFKKANFFCSICHVFYATVKGFDRHLEWFHPNYQKTYNDVPSTLKDRRSSPRKKLRVEFLGNEDSDTEIEETEIEELESADEEDEGERLTNKQCRKEINDDNESIISILSDALVEDLSSCDEEPEFKIKMELMGPPPNFFHCKICDKLRSSENKLKKHYEKQHPNEEFKKPNTLAIVKSSKKKTNISCKFCFQHFKKFSYLNQHISKNHGTKYPAKMNVKDYNSKNKNLFLCKICHMPYSTLRGIISHFEYSHKNHKLPKASSQNYRVQMKEYIYEGKFGDLKSMFNANENIKCNESNRIDESKKEKSKFMTEKAERENIAGQLVSLDKDKDILQAEASFSENEKENQAESSKLTTNNENEVSGSDEPQSKVKTVSSDRGNENQEQDLNVKKYTCKVCNIGWGYRAFLDNHIKRWHPDYYDLYPKEKLSAEAILKRVMEDTRRIMKAKETTRVRTLGRKKTIKKKPKSGRRRLLLVVPNQELSAKSNDDNKGDESSNDGSERGEVNQNVSSDSDSRENARDLSTKHKDESPVVNKRNEKPNHFYHQASISAETRKNIYQVPDIPLITTQSNHLAHHPRTQPPNNPPIPMQHRRMGRPSNASNNGDLLHNILHSSGIGNERQVAMNNISVPTIGPAHPYNNQLYQNYLSSFDQYPGMNQNPVFPTPSFGERPEHQTNQGKEFAFPDWDSIFTSPIKNKNVPVTAANLMNTYNQSGHHNAHANSQVHERLPNSSHFANSHPGHPYPGMQFQNQALNHDPCLMTPQSGLHQPYLNPNIPSTSHHSQPNYSNTILQNQLIPLASVANYQGPPGNSSSSTLTLIGEKSTPRHVNQPQNAQKPPQVPNLASDSEEEPNNINETGFGINYDSESSCDDPKKNNPKDLVRNQSVENKEKKSYTTINNNNSNINSTLFENRFLQFSKNKNKMNDPEKIVETSKNPEETSEKVDDPISETSRPNNNKDKEETICSLTLKELEEARAKVHFCKECPMYYVKKKFLILHYERDHPNSLDLIADLKKETEELQKEGNILTCRFCDKKWNGQYKLNRHIQSCHNEGRFQCNLCDEAFSRKHTLTRHLETHFSKESYKCDICQKEFKTQDTFEKHRYRHKENCPFKCSNCDRAFSSETGLKKHTENYCKKNYDCPDCDKVFDSRQNLKRHSYEHLDNRLHCPTCSKKFTRQRNLKNHVEKYCPKNSQDGKPKRKYTKKSVGKKAKDISEDEVEDSLGEEDEELNFSSSSETNERKEKIKENDIDSDFDEDSVNDRDEVKEKPKAPLKKVIRRVKIVYEDSDEDDEPVKPKEKKTYNISRPSRACRPKSLKEIDLDI